jgi:hypothetical protein
MTKDIQEASKMFQMAGWKDYSEERILSFVNQMDKKWKSEEDNMQKK